METAFVLVEGESDRVALHTLARRLGRDLEREGVEVVALAGATNVGRWLEDLAATGASPSLAGLYDAPEERFFRRGLERGGRGPVPDRSAPRGARVLRLRARPGARADPCARGGCRGRGHRGAGGAALAADPAAPAGLNASSRPSSTCTGSSAPAPVARASTRRRSSRHWTSTVCPRRCSGCSTGCERRSVEDGRTREVRGFPEPAEHVRPLEDQLGVVLPGDRDARRAAAPSRRPRGPGRRSSRSGPRQRADAGARRSAPTGPRGTPPPKPSRPRTRTAMPRPARACRPSGA